MAVYEVCVAEYMGDGFWSDSAPYEFDSRVEAERFRDLINTSMQAGGKCKAREIVERQS